MNRRESLKTLSLSLGSIIATPTLFQLLSSCEASKGEIWTPQFLSLEEGFVVEQLVNLILPSSKTIGTLDVHIPQFIDLILNEVPPNREQNNFNKGANVFHKTFETVFNKEVSKGTEDEFLTLLTTYFKITPKKQARIFELMETDINNVTDKDTFYLYAYLIFKRYYSLFSYYTSKKVGTEILNYDPIPGAYNPCAPLDEVGNVYAL